MNPGFLPISPSDISVDSFIILRSFFLVIFSDFDLAEVRKVEFQVVYGPNFDIECVGILKLALMGKIKMYRLPDRDAVNFSHFRVIDGMHVCADFKKHDGGKFWFNNINLGREMMKRFEIA
ncbi:unnamed protein product, partial [marine sediment metagenome]